MKKYNNIFADFLSKVNFFFASGFISTNELYLRRPSERFIPVRTGTGGRADTFVLPYCYSAFVGPSALRLVPCLLFIVPFLFSSCENDPREIEDWTKNVVLREEARTVESYLSQGGVMKAKLTAPLMYRYQRDSVYTEFPNTLHVDFYDDSVRVESWLTSMYGIYYDNLNKVFLRDSVMVVNREGDTLRTPELWWDQNSQKFYTDKPARLDGKDKHLIGTQGLEATQDLKSIQFKYPIGPFNIKEGNMP